MRLLERMAEQAVLLGWMLRRQRSSSGVVAAHTATFHCYPPVALGQGSAKRAVPVVNGGAFGLVPEAVQNQNQQQTSHDSNETQITFTQKHDGPFHLTISSGKTLQPPLFPMVGQILASRPLIPVYRRNDTTARESLEEAGDVGIGGDLAGGDDGVGVRHPHHPLVKGPVTELAQGHAVADVVVLAPAPGDDMGGIHHGVLFRRDDPHPAEGAAVVIGLHHNAAKALITGCGAVVVRLDDFLHQRQMGFFFQQSDCRRMPRD